MKMIKDNIIITDPLYKQIVLPKELGKFIDLKEFQRLRNIKQTSFLDQLYPSATHSRFTHSIGVCHLMSKILERFDLSEKEKFNFLLAGLLHDLGHGPFSHVFEKVFPQFDHERATREILAKYKLKEVVEILDKKHPLSALISSLIDVDKLDYMARDSYFCGVSYGLTEVDYILQNFTIDDHKIIISKKVIASLENLLNQRITLYKNVYYHKFTQGYEFLFEKIFERAKDLYAEKIEIYLEENLRTFFDGTNTIENLQELDDVIILYHIKKWALSPDKILSDLATRFLNRAPFKAINLSYQFMDVERVKKNTEKKYPIKYYFGQTKKKIKVTENEVFVDYHGKYVKIEKISPLFEFFRAQIFEINYLMFPKDV